MQQRGMTLVEIALAAAIAVIAAAAIVSLSQGMRAFGERSAVQQFDAVLAYAQALAATSGNGATLVFARRTAPDGAARAGFVLTVYAGRPTSADALKTASIAPVSAEGGVSEAKLGAPPFSIFLNGAGHASAASGAVAPGTVIAGDPGCPSGEASVVLRFGDPRASQTRSLACNGVP